MIDRAEEEWWKSYFDERFLSLYRARLPEEQTREEVSAVLEILGLPTEARVLDLACGWGRHAVPLQEAGMHVVGLDRSLSLLKAAQRHGTGGRRVQWVCGDMRELPFIESFDAVVSLFSSLGYFGSDAEDLRVLRSVAAALRPGGRLLLETMHRDAVVRDFAERDWWEGEQGERVWVEREFDAIEGVNREWLHWRTSDGAEGTKFHEVRIRAATEWKALLDRAELRPIDWYGDWDASPFDLDSPRLVLVAGRE